MEGELNFISSPTAEKANIYHLIKTKKGGFIMKSEHKGQEKKDKKLIKPEPIAVNAPSGGYAAGCPSKNSYQCTTCFRK